MADRVGSPHRGNVSSLVNWEQGQSGNPKGRPKKNHALIDYVHQKTSGGKKLIDELYKIAMHEDSRDRDRMRAIELLLERGFGKNVQPVQLDAEVNVVRSLDTFSDQELIELVELRRKLREGNAPVIEGEAVVL